MSLVSELRHEAGLASRAGQMERLERIASDVERILLERDHILVALMRVQRALMDHTLTSPELLDLSLYRESRDAVDKLLNALP